MTILLPTLAVAFAAFCVWLTVRIVNRRERWAKWTLIALVVLFFAYPLSIGPLFWLADHGFIPDPAKQPLRYVYYPLMYAILESGRHDVFYWYVTFWGHEFEPEAIPPR
jgi:hypothetical protein